MNTCYVTDLPLRNVERDYRGFKDDRLPIISTITFEIKKHSVIMNMSSLSSEREAFIKHQ